MDDNQNLFNKILRRRGGYSNPVYDPSYVYNPNLKWFVLAAILIIMGLGIWISIWASNKREPALSQNVATMTASETDDQPKELYSVQKVVDGDTLDVLINGKTERIRLIGVDTPETVDPRTTVQCFGKEASEKAKSLLTNTSVRLEQDATQGERDKYGRVLAYVFLEDGTHFNKYMIAEGYAHEYTYAVPYKYQQEFKAAEASASSGNKGLWSPGTCGGDTSSAPVPTPVTSTQPSRSASQPAASSSNCDPNYTPCIPNVSYDLDCADVGVQVRVTGSDRHRLDRDGDGSGCESY